MKLNIKTKDKNGITLVALIVTVVIIVIAAAQVMTAELLSGLQCQQE